MNMFLNPLFARCTLGALDICNTFCGNHLLRFPCPGAPTAHETAWYHSWNGYFYLQCRSQAFTSKLIKSICLYSSIYRNVSIILKLLIRVFITVDKDHSLSNWISSIAFRLGPTMFNWRQTFCWSKADFRGRFNRLFNFKWIVCHFLAVF